MFSNSSRHLQRRSCAVKSMPLVCARIYQKYHVIGNISNMKIMYVPVMSKEKERKELQNSAVTMPGHRILKLVV